MLKISHCVEIEMDSPSMLQESKISTHLYYLEIVFQYWTIRKQRVRNVNFQRKNTSISFFVQGQDMKDSFMRSTGTPSS